MYSNLTLSELWPKTLTLTLIENCTKFILLILHVFMSLA